MAAKPVRPLARDWPPRVIATKAGYWLHKKMRNGHLEVYRLGRWDQGVTANQAYVVLQSWQKYIDDGVPQRDIPRSVRAATAPSDSDGYTVGRLVTDDMARLEARLEAGEVSAHTIASRRAAGKILKTFFGESRTMASLRPGDFEALLLHIKQSLPAPGSQKRRVLDIRAIINRPVRKKLLPPVDMGQEFAVSDKTVRRHRDELARQHGEFVFSRDQILAILKLADTRERAMVLLAINFGFEPGCIAQLSLAQGKQIVEEDWHTIPRPKTGEKRRGCPWPETRTAMQAYLAVRPAPATPEDVDAFFLTNTGRAYAHPGGRYDGAATRRASKKMQLVNNLIRRAGITHPKLTPYAFRSTFATYGSPASRGYALEASMGHRPKTVTRDYVKLVQPEDVCAVAQAVHDWLFKGETHVGKRPTRVTA